MCCRGMTKSWNLQWNVLALACVYMSSQELVASGMLKLVCIMAGYKNTSGTKVWSSIQV